MHEPIDDAGGWRCRHAEGEHRLRTTDGAPPSAPGRPGRITCPRCGTEWRFWTAARVAKPTIEGRPSPTGVRRAALLDVDHVVAGVRGAVPDVEILACEQPHAGDDDGLWRFSRAGRCVQIESNAGMVPFLVEDDAGAREVGAVRDVVAQIVAALRA